MQNLQNTLVDILKNDPQYTSDGKLLKNKLTEDALKLEPALLKYLLNNDRLKKHFFIDVDGALVFDKDKFIQFVNDKEFLPDSYTSFRNKIGLLDEDGKYFSEKRDVVLAWPYKDCVLEGGQDKEDQKRDEIFYNEVLAPDEIDRLFDPKVLTNFKRYDKDGEHENPENINRDDNLIIKGNNLLALHSLKKLYRGKVKLIYIDPPYNTGNDSFGYNDKFNHSTWLTFMKTRLEISRELLSNNGSILIQLDYNESHYFKVFMDEIFGSSNFKNEIVWQRTTNTGSSKGMANKLSNDTDSILYYSKTSENIFNKIYREYSKEYLDRFKYEDDYGKYRWQYMATYSENKLRELQSKKRIRWDDKSKNPEYKQYLHELKGIPLNNLWTDIFHINPMAKESVGFKTQKPEQLLSRIINMTTQEGDLVLDFFIGSGTTAAVAHKLGRQYIGIEQLEYGSIIPINRMKSVIEGKQVTILKEVDWQGGGSFVYAELKKWNQNYIDEIEDAKTTKKLLTIYKKMKEEAFFRYDVDLSQFPARKTKSGGEEKDFSKLALDKQKEVLIECLDKNHLYVNLSEIDDTTYSISDEDKAMNKKFYGPD